MELRPTETSPIMLAKYEALFTECFPGASHLNTDYLTWLYRDNPAGTVVGFDAWEGDALAAHYVCVPVDAVLNGNPARLLLSLNTATAPAFQGKGLFTRLADATYQHAASHGFDAIYGVANANSTPGFIRKLGFDLLTPLDAKVGIGPLPMVDDTGSLRQQALFHRLWRRDALSWRLGSPARPYQLVRSGQRIAACTATGRAGIAAWAEPMLETPLSESLPSPPTRIHLQLGLIPETMKVKGLRWFDIPDRFRASPLNLIFKPLQSGVSAPPRDAILFGQLDFDAF